MVREKSGNFNLRSLWEPWLETPRRGGSKKYPQSMFWSNNKKNKYTPAYPSFAIYKSGVKEVYITWTCFSYEGFFSLSRETVLSQYDLKLLSGTLNMNITTIYAYKCYALVILIDSNKELILK